MKLPHVLRPSAYRRMFGRIFRILNGPAPLNEYPDYDEYWRKRSVAGRVARTLHRHRLIADLLPHSASVLDIGCGDGVFGSHILQVRPDCKYRGLDISASSVQMARAAGLDADVLTSDRTLLEQVGPRIDVVTIMEVLEHVHDAEELFRSILSLNPGTVVVTIPNVGFWMHRIRLALFGRFPVTTIIFHMKEHIRFWTYKDFVQWVSLFDVEIVGFYGQKGVGSKLGDYLAVWFPKICAAQVVYVLRPRESA